VPVATDWLAVAKTGAVIAAFLACTADIIVGHATPDVTSLDWALGATIGVLRLADVAANIANVRAFLNKPGSGVVPQALGTPLITTTPTPAGS
jgi:hypothetical protein